MYADYLVHFNPNHDKLGRFTYSNFKSPTELSSFMSGIKYKTYDRLMSPKQVLKTKTGSCHDQVMLELNELKKQKLDPKAGFIMAVDKNGNGGETHTFVIFNKNDKAYWFENAWNDKKGIHEFNNESEATKHIINEFKKRNKGQTIYLSDFNPDDHKIGETLEKFVDICMDDAIKV